MILNKISFTTQKDGQKLHAILWEDGDATIWTGNPGQHRSCFVLTKAKREKLIKFLQNTPPKKKSRR